MKKILDKLLTITICIVFVAVAIAVPAFGKVLSKKMPWIALAITVVIILAWAVPVVLQKIKRRRAKDKESTSKQESSSTDQIIEVQGTGEQVQASEVATRREVPLRKDGQPDYDMMPADMFLEEYSKVVPREDALADLRDLHVDLQKSIKSIQSSKVTSLNKKADNRAKLTQLQAKVSEIAAVLEANADQDAIDSNVAPVSYNLGDQVQLSDGRTARFIAHAEDGTMSARVAFIDPETGDQETTDIPRSQIMGLATQEEDGDVQIEGVKSFDPKIEAKKEPLQALQKNNALGRKTKIALGLLIAICVAFACYVHWTNNSYKLIKTDNVILKIPSDWHSKPYDEDALIASRLISNDEGFITITVSKDEINKPNAGFYAKRLISSSPNKGFSMTSIHETVSGRRFNQSTSETRLSNIINGETTGGKVIVFNTQHRTITICYMCEERRVGRFEEIINGLVFDQYDRYHKLPLFDRMKLAVNSMKKDLPRQISDDESYIDVTIDRNKITHVYQFSDLWDYTQKETKSLSESAKNITLEQYRKAASTMVIEWLSAGKVIETIYYAPNSPEIWLRYTVDLNDMVNTGHVSNARAKISKETSPKNYTAEDVRNFLRKSSEEAAADEAARAAREDH